MLENLIEILPERRTPLLRKELALVGVSAKRSFPDAADQVLAEESDLQGMGGSQDENWHGGELATLT